MGIRVLSAVLSSPNGHNALIIAARPHAGGGGGGGRSTEYVLCGSSQPLRAFPPALPPGGGRYLHDAYCENKA